MKAALAVLALVWGTSGCAATSCPGVFLGPGIHVDATAWVGDVPLDEPSLKATVCIAATCSTATPIQPGGFDLFAGLTLPTDTATVRVQLTLSTGRTLDQTTTGKVTHAKPFGSGCGGRDEVDLTVTKAGTLVPGEPGKVS